ncbi:MAG: response regulator transcription factor [Planctomycetia bacterium]|nr:response regulator transcription factor [Planctomycetia bacterium]
MGAIAQPPRDEPAKVLLVDQHPAAREGLALCLSQHAGFQVCGEVGDIPSALQLLAEHEPKAVVTSIALAGGSGFDLLKRIRDRYPTVRVLIWSRYSESVYAERAIRAGAAGFIEKDQPTELVVAALRHILGGGIYLSPTMTESLLRQASGRGQEIGADPVAQLSDREMEVFRLMGLGYDTNKIAAELHLSAKTVETYRARIKQKFGVETGTQLIQLAVRWGLENG